jgi:hypothetical protein
MITAGGDLVGVAKALEREVIVEQPVIEITSQKA